MMDGAHIHKYGENVHESSGPANQATKSADYQANRYHELQNKTALPRLSPRYPIGVNPS